MKELNLEDLRMITGGEGLSQEDVDNLALLLTMNSKSELIDMVQGICPKCKKKFADQSNPGYIAIVHEHYASCDGK